MTDTPNLSRRHVLALAASLPVVALAGPALAAKPEVYASNGVAINGYDPVAYFTEGDAVEGSSSYETQWRGATWRFASAGNQAQFEANPEGFAPQYGGYCAYAVSKGGTATTSPDAWTVHEGKLYLNFNKVVRGIWSRDIPGHVAKADANWPSVLA